MKDNRTAKRKPSIQVGVYQTRAYGGGTLWYADTDRWCLQHSDGWIVTFQHLPEHFTNLSKAAGYFASLRRLVIDGETDPYTAIQEGRFTPCSVAGKRCWEFVGDICIKRTPDIVLRALIGLSVIP